MQVDIEYKQFVYEWRTTRSECRCLEVDPSDDVAAVAGQHSAFEHVEETEHNTTRNLYSLIHW